MRSPRILDINVKGRKVEIKFSDISGTLHITKKFCNRSDFVKPLKKYSIFTKVSIDNEMNSIMWPSGYSLNINDIYRAFKRNPNIVFK